MPALSQKRSDPGLSHLQVWLPLAPLYAAVCSYVNTQMAAVAREVAALRQAKYEFKKV